MKRAHLPISPTLCLLAALTTAAASAAQDGILYYKFDAIDTTRVANHASGAGAAPRFGDAFWPPEYLYAPGHTGGALDHSMFMGLSGMYVLSGFTGPIQGDLTIAFFLKNGIANSIAEYSPVAGQPSWSIATGGTAGPGLQLRGTGVGTLNGTFNTALCSMPGWNHFAIVVDAGNGLATWYHNGAPSSSQPITGNVNIGVQNQLVVGSDYVTMCGGLYLMDDFRIVNRAVTATEIAQWSAGPTATAVTFTEPGAQMTLEALGAPHFGNTAFAVRATTASPSLVAFARGLSYANMQGLALPLDLGTLLPGAAGQPLLVAPLLVDLAIAEEGIATLPLPVPGDPVLAGFTIVMQAVALDGQNQLRASNGVLLGVGGQ